MSFHMKRIVIFLFDGFMRIEEGERKENIKNKGKRLIEKNRCRERERERRFFQDKKITLMKGFRITCPDITNKTQKFLFPLNANLNQNNWLSNNSMRFLRGIFNKQRTIYSPFCVCLCESVWMDGQKIDRQIDTQPDEQRQTNAYKINDNN